MTPSKLKTILLTLRFFTLRSSFCVFLLPLLFLSSCSSARLRHEAAMRVLDRQSELLLKVREERTAQSFVTKVRSDPVLLWAENHLIQTIQALQKSNRAVKAAL